MPQEAGLARLRMSARTTAPHDRSPTPMEPQASSTPVVPRVRISCPGCGRNDHVSWPDGQEVYHWKCFNCGKEFDLTRDGGH